MKICTFLGTRPEITKLSSLLPLLDNDPSIEHILIHTGQHYNPEMDEIFFQQLQLQKPKYNFHIGSQSPAKQTAQILEQTEQILLTESPHLVIVQGDTNTAPAVSIAAAKLHIPLMHIEAGCRSFNKNMPEEINRIIADHLATYLIAPDKQSLQNLKNENITKNVFLLGSTAFDTVERNTQFINQTILSELNIKANQYLLVTLHRAENTNNEPSLNQLINTLNTLAPQTTLVFPLHPRTKNALKKYNIQLNPNIKIIPPQPYLTFLSLLANCQFCLSDSGGIQEEALVFNKPCIILRNETEWTRLVEQGKNILAGTTLKTILPIVETLLNKPQELERIKNLPCNYPQNVSQTILQIIKDIKQEKTKQERK